MTRLQVIEKYIAPIYAKLGYQMSYSPFDKSSGICEFKRDSHSTIQYDLRSGSHLPNEVERYEHFFRELMDGKRHSLPPALLVRFYLNLDAGHIAINPSEMRGGEHLRFASIYTSLDELKALAEQYTEASVQFVLPYLNEVHERIIWRDDDMYQALAEKTVDRGIRFAEKHGLSITGGKTTVEAVDRILTDMYIGKEYRELPFYDRQEEIIDMAAYCGEVILHRYKGIWQLLYDSVSDPLVIPGPKFVPYGLVLDTMESGRFKYEIDILISLIVHWTFFPELSSARYSNSRAAAFMYREFTEDEVCRFYRLLG